MNSIPFNNARGAASLLQMAPPFSFSDVTMSVFPLRANLTALNAFCDNYLNPAPDMVQFRPFIPYVYLVILDYGRMSVEAANMGWISQREVAFGVPMRWLSATDDGLEFTDWAFTSPFIFVDNELSMSTGREVFGWPKLLAKLDPSVSEWVRDPHGSRRVFEVSTQGALHGYTGETSEYHPLLSVHQHRNAGLFDIPPKLDAVTKPISQMSGLALNAARLSMELSKTFLGMASDGITGSAVLPDFSDLGTFREQLEPDNLKSWLTASNWTSGLKDSLWSMFPRFYANTVNLKQFRDTSNPHRTCYQAITNAKMPVTAFKAGGFLGPQAMLLGQLDGGYSIEIHDLAGLPIVDSLGLEVAETRESVNGTTVSCLTPVAPLWMRVDMTYGLGETVIWRGRRNTWNEGTAQRRARLDAERQHLTVAERRALAAPDRPRRAAAAVDAHKETVESEGLEIDDGQGFDYLRTMNFFNTARGASEAVGGSFSLPDAAMNVSPLKADPAALQDFVSNYLKIEDHMQFEAWGDFVYLVVCDFKHMNSQQSAISSRRAREMSLMVPVKAYSWYSTDEAAEIPAWWDAAPGERDEHGRRRLLTTGFVNAFTFVDDVETSITANEVFGVPCLPSTIAAGENDWLGRNRGAEFVDEIILSMRAKVLPEVMAGAKAVDRDLVQIWGDRNFKEVQPHKTVENTVNAWVQVLAGDLGRKTGESGRSFGPGAQKIDRDQIEAVNAGQGFAMGLLAGELPFNQFTLKQFRDGEQTMDACYQGLVQRRHVISKIEDVSELPGPLHITITDYPTQPITKLLGLVPKFSYPGTDRIVRVFEPIRPFSFNGNLMRGAGLTLFERVGGPDWQAVDLPEQMFGWRTLTKAIADKLVPQGTRSGGPNVLVAKDPEGQEAEHMNKDIKVRKALEVQEDFERRRREGTADNIMIRDRVQDETVAVITSGRTLDKYEAQAGMDVAAWYAQAMDETPPSYSQSDAAAMIERFNPATIVDMVLSRQWGKTQYSRYYSERYADFCVPVATVPPAYMEPLFPQRERQGAYWPRSKAYYDMEMIRWRQETNAFRYALESSLRLLSLGFPQTHPDLSQTLQEALVQESNPAKAFAAVAKVYNARLDPEHKAISRAFVARLSDAVEKVNDELGVGRGFEDIGFEFFSRFLPEKVRLGRRSLFGQDSAFVALMMDGNEVFSAADWTEIAGAVRQIATRMQDICEQIPPEVMHLDGMAARAEKNAMLFVENDVDKAPDEVLRARLRATMAPGL